MLNRRALQLVNYWLFSLFYANIFLINYSTTCDCAVFIKPFWDIILVLIAECNWPNWPTCGSRGFLQRFIFCYLIIWLWVFGFWRAKCHNFAIYICLLLLWNIVEWWFNILSNLRENIGRWGETRFCKVSIWFPYVRKFIIRLNFSRVIITIIAFSTCLARIQWSWLLKADRNIWTVLVWLQSFKRHLMMWTIFHTFILSLKLRLYAFIILSMMTLRKIVCCYLILMKKLVNGFDIVVKV